MNGSVCTTTSTANTATTDGTNTIPVETSHANWARPSAYPTRSSPRQARPQPGIAQQKRPETARRPPPDASCCARRAPAARCPPPQPPPARPGPRRPLPTCLRPSTEPPGLPFSRSRSRSPALPYPEHAALLSPYPSLDAYRDARSGHPHTTAAIRQERPPTFVQYRSRRRSARRRPPARVSRALADRQHPRRRSNTRHRPGSPHAHHCHHHPPGRHRSSPRHRHARPDQRLPRRPGLPGRRPRHGRVMRPPTCPPRTTAATRPRPGRPGGLHPRDAQVPGRGDAAAAAPHAADGHQLLRPALHLRRPALPLAAVRRRPAGAPPGDRGQRTMRPWSPSLPTGPRTP